MPITIMSHRLDMFQPSPRAIMPLLRGMDTKGISSLLTESSTEGRCSNEDVRVQGRCSSHFVQREQSATRSLILTIDIVHCGPRTRRARFDSHNQHCSSPARDNALFVFTKLPVRVIDQVLPASSSVCSPRISIPSNPTLLPTSSCDFC